MNFQEIRKYYELPVVEACNDAGVTYRAENTLEPNGDAITTYAWHASNSERCWSAIATVDLSLISELLHC